MSNQELLAAMGEIITRSVNTAIDQKLDERFEKFEKKICADDEDIHLGSPRDFIELWTKKESIYKCCGSGHFSAKSINTRQYLTLSESIVLDEEFVFSVCGDDIDNNRIFLIDTDFSIIKK